MAVLCYEVWFGLLYGTTRMGQLVLLQKCGNSSWQTTVSRTRYGHTRTTKLAREQVYVLCPARVLASLLCGTVPEVFLQVATVAEECSIFPYRYG